MASTPQPQEIQALPKSTTPFEPDGLEAAIHLANTLARSALLPEALQGKPADVLIILITGHELGLSPMQAIRNMAVVKGKAVMEAALKVALCLRKPDVCEYFRPVETTDTKAVYETRRKGHPGPTKLEFTIEQARTAGLLGKDNWKNYPAAMLRARCSSALATAVYPDLVAGIYTPDEADEIAGPSIVAPPEPAFDGTAATATVATTAQPVGDSPAAAAQDPLAPLPSDPVAHWKKQIAGAAGLAELEKLLPDLKLLPQQQRNVLVPIYNARKAEFAANGNGAANGKGA